MDNIVYFLKFGQRSHVEHFAQQNVYCSNAITLRGIEAKLFIKGQGDRLEGGSSLFAQKYAMLTHDTNELMMVGQNARMIVHYEPANKIPVFCLFSVFSKDCYVDEAGNHCIKLSNELKDTIRTHFPKADAVAIVKQPERLIDEIKRSIGFNIKTELVHYFNIENGYDSERSALPAMDLEYFKYLSQDTSPQKIDGGEVYSFNADYVFRALFCKDVFFRQEQEYRILLPDIQIEDGQSFPVAFSENIEVQQLDDFLREH